MTNLLKVDESSYLPKIKYASSSKMIKPAMNNYTLKSARKIKLIETRTQDSDDAYGSKTPSI